MRRTTTTYAWCPFREVAENHRDVACQLHLGLMQGALRAEAGPVPKDPAAMAGRVGWALAARRDHRVSAQGGRSGRGRDYEPWRPGPARD